MAEIKKREGLTSRIGFLLLSAGCAIGLGNVWRFPYITGKYGGATFVLIYLIFLVILGVPVMVIEFAIGRASQQNIGIGMKTLEEKGSKWHIYGPIAIIGCYVLMMFYTTVTGWMLNYFYGSMIGKMEGLSAEKVGEAFGAMLGSPSDQLMWMVITVVVCIAICSLGVKKGVEKITKFMMLALFSLMLLLAFNSLRNGSKEGIAFYLIPSLDGIRAYGWGEVIFAAMGQAFFTLSLGIGALAIFGSYIGKSHTLTGEGLNVVALDTFVAVISGLIIFPAAFSFHVEPNAGPGLIFITLPNVFNQMPIGRLWGSLFFLFMSFAALSTVVAVFENIISYWIDVHNWSRAKASLFNLVLIIALSIPCALGFNVLSGFQPLGAGSSVLDLEDFIVSTTLLPLGSLIFVLFVTRRGGWAYKKFLEEANTGMGPKFPTWATFYVKWILPIIIVIIFIKGYWDTFSKLLF